MSKAAIRITFINITQKKLQIQINWIKQLMENWSAMQNKINVLSSVGRATMVKNPDFFLN